MPNNIYDPRRDITAIILAGGASSRMGTDKALLTWKERPFVEHIVACLRAQVDRIAINTNTPADFTQFGLPLIADATIERCGPLAGIAAALHDSSTALTLIVPCDNPLLSPQLLARLLAALESEQTDLAFACSSGDSHYLYALMRSDLHDNLAGFLRDHDYAVRHWYATLRASRVDFSDQPEYFRNINSAEELALLLGR
jgi:molybdenum cofactor guanylyltransferase